MYTISSESFGDFEKIILKNSVTGEYISIVPGFGCNINEVVLNNGVRNFNVVYADTNLEEFVINKGYKSCILLPYPNRIKLGTYTFEGSTFRLPTNDAPNSLHGLLLYKPFEVIHASADENGAQLNVRYRYEKDHEGYPFNFDTEIHLTFNHLGLTKNTIVTNTSEGNIPIGDGWHMYFQGESLLDNCTLHFAGEKILVADAALIPTGVTKDFTEFNQPTFIGTKVFDDCFIISQNQPIAEVVFTDPAIDLSVTAWQETGNRKYNYLQIYTSVDRKSIAIEPMTCQPDAFNNKEGLIVLTPNETIQWACGIRVTKAIH